MPELKHFALLCGSGDIAIEAAAADGEGKPSLPKLKMLCYGGGMMSPAIGPSPMVLDLAGVKLAAKSIPIRFAHDAAQSSGIGHTDSVDIGTKQIQATGVISRDTEAAREVVASAKKGFPWQVSVGGPIDEYEYIREGQTAQANGKTFKGPFYMVRKSTLAEISLCDLGADVTTKAQVAAKNAVGVTMPNSNQPETTEPEPIADPGLAAERRRCLQIQTHLDNSKATSQACTELAAKAIAGGWSFEQFEVSFQAVRLAELRASRAEAPYVHGGTRGIPTNMKPSDVIAAAALLKIGSRKAAVKRFGDSVCDAADQLRITCDTDLARASLYLSGHDVPIGGNDAIVRAAFSVRASFPGMSTSTLPEALTLAAETELREGYDAAPDTTISWVARKSVNDFKPVADIQPYQVGGSYDEVPPGGELNMVAFDHQVFTRKARTYGQVGYIDRQTVMNDSIGAVFEVQRENGRRAMQRKLRQIYSTLLANGSNFFSEAHGNLLTGSDSALSVVALTAAVRMFREQVDGDGIPIGVVPVTLVTCPALEFVAKQILRSTILERSQSGVDQEPTGNPLNSIVNLEVEPMLGNTAVHANASQTAWYIFGNPGHVPAMTLSLLGGNELPVIETVDLPANYLGIGFRSYFDFGADLADYRTGFRSDGA